MSMYECEYEYDYDYDYDYPFCCMANITYQYCFKFFLSFRSTPFPTYAPGLSCL